METAWSRAERMLDSYLPTVWVAPLERRDGSATTGEVIDPTPVMLGCINCAYDEKDHTPHPESYEIHDTTEDAPHRYRLTPHRRVSHGAAKCLKCGLERRWGSL